MVTRNENVFVRRTPPKANDVFDIYWQFAAERQEIFHKRYVGLRPPWTTDPVLAQYKFTNAYRASDRVSQFLIRRVIYEGDSTPQQVFFRILLFKFFNKIETWQLLESRAQQIRRDEKAFARYEQTLGDAFASGKKLYSGAYIMPPGTRLYSVRRKHEAHLRLIRQLTKLRFVEKVQQARTMSAVFALLRQQPLIGNFLAYQLATDINYSALTSFSEMEFTMPGPGAKSGIRKCFDSLGEYTEADVIRLAAEHQSTHFERLGLRFRDLWGRSLQLIDCQNLFCEVDKYTRVALPKVSGLGGRTKIKQRFKPTLEPLDYMYPPKWRVRVASSAGPLQRTLF